MQLAQLADIWQYLSLLALRCEILGNPRARFLLAHCIFRLDLPEAAVRQCHRRLRLELYCLLFQHPKDQAQRPLDHNLNPRKNLDSSLGA